MVVMAASEDAEGGTQADLTPQMLKALEKRTIESVEAKTRAHMKSTGQSTSTLPKFRSESHYVEIGGMKLAVVRIKVPKIANQVFLFGIKGSELRRVVCIRTAMLEENIPIFSGPCGEKVKETYGISLVPN